MKKLTDTAIRIRTLLDEIYDTTLVLDFHELCQKYAECYEVPINLLFYIKERKWFEEERKRPDPFLKFNYLSFELKDGALRFFDNPKALEMREQKLTGEGYVRHISRNCAIWLNPEEVSVYDFEPIENLTKRLFVSFYRNCGSFDHFRESVSLRFARELHKSVEEITEDNVVKFIHDRLNLQLHIFHQKDELHFTPEASFQELIKDSTASIVLPRTLVEDPVFNNAFKASVLRKNQTFGKSSCGKFRFAIATQSEEYFIHNEMIGHRTIKQRPKLCLVYLSEFHHLDLEEIYHATRIVSLFLHFSEIHDRENLLSFYSARTLELEESLSEEPVEIRQQLDDILARSIRDILSFALRLSDAEGFTFYKLEPHRNLLVSDIVSQDISVEISLDEQSPHAQAFLRCEPLDIWHPDKLRHDIREARQLDTDESHAKAAISKRWLIDSTQVASASCIGPRAACIAPIVKGRTPIGLVEFHSPSSSRLSHDMPIFRTAAELIGEITYRAELANDRGWLTKLSFIQVARHRIENIVEEVHGIDPGLAEKLRSSFINPQTTATQTSPGAEDSQSLVEALRNYIEERDIRIDEPAGFWEKFSILRDFEPLSPSVSRAIADVMETLLSNSIHSPFQPDDLEVLVSSEESRFPYVRLRYAPHEVNVPLDRAKRLCTAPIRRSTSPTYHYGLFLCGTQLRMIGGHAVARVSEKRGFASSPFELTFHIPLRIRRSENGRSA